jgi:protein-S-isoprenylcysteine O-methyltransferase Ste14/truncated hemoglobin YjbI
MSKKTLYERIGGSEVILKICDSLYARVLLDDRLADFFLGMDVDELVHRQERFFDCLLDDRKSSLAQLRKVHQPLVNKRGLTHFHFDAMVELLELVMAEEGIDALLRREVIGRVEQTRKEVLHGQHKKEERMISKIAGLIYGGVSYAIGMASLVYIGLWLGNIGIVNALDAPRVSSVFMSVLTNLGLIVLFGLQHSGMARPRFKRALTRFIPSHLERSTYVLVSGIATAAMVFFWQPMGGVVWQAVNPGVTVAIYTLYVLGWILLVLSTFWINHFDLFGLRQVWLNFRGQPYTHIPFKTPGLYQFIRHPLYVGWLTVMWAAPLMTVAHLAFAITSTIYIFIAIRYEERDLADALPEYRKYREETPMLVPNMPVIKKQEPALFN